MAEFLTLRGRNALSPFRVKNLLAHLAGTRITGLAAEFWHFVEIAPATVRRPSARRSIGC